MIKKVIIIYFVIFIIVPSMTIKSIAVDNEIDWTEDELRFIANHPVIKLGVDSQFIPFEFIDEEGEYKGIVADYLSLISERTGLQFEVESSAAWPIVYDLALTGKLDVLPAIGKTYEREDHFLFSEPYYYFKRVLVTSDTKDGLSSLEDLTGKTVAVQRNSSHHSYLLNSDNINLSLYDSVEAALAAVVTGEELAFIGNLATTNYLIQTNGLIGLKVVTFEATEEQAVYFAVHPDLPELVTIFNKAMRTISEEEKAEINQKWIGVETDFDYGAIIRIIIIIVTVFLIIVAVSSFWIMRLRKEIARRKRIQLSLEEAKREADEANNKLLIANEELEKISMVDGLTGVFNRRYFDSFLEKLWDINMREQFPIALIMIDIDRFKAYNDTYGHLAGDQCIKAVANIIDRTLTRSGDFVARYGGEEFSVLLSNVTEDEATEIAEMIRVEIEKAIIDNGVAETSITASSGVAVMVSTNEIKIDDLIDTADRALYQAKREGRNRVVRASSLVNKIR